MVGDRREQQNPDAGAASGPVRETDDVRLPWGPHPVRMARAAVLVYVHVKLTAPCAREEGQCEHDDDAPDRRLRVALYRLRQVRAVEDDRSPEREQLVACPIPQTPPSFAPGP